MKKRKKPERVKRPTPCVEVRVELKPGVADAEAMATLRALELLGVRGLKSVKTARIYALYFLGISRKEALRQTNLSIERLLANPVIHHVRLRMVPSPSNE